MRDPRIPESNQYLIGVLNDLGTRGGAKAIHKNSRC
jgi:hypothetical protein